MSPQPWAQTHSNSNKHHGAGSDNTGNKVKLFWNNQRNTRTSPMNASGIAFPLFDYCQKIFQPSSLLCKDQQESFTPNFNLRTVLTQREHEVTWSPSKDCRPIQVDQIVRLWSSNLFYLAIHQGRQKAMKVKFIYGSKSILSSSKSKQYGITLPRRQQNLQGLSWAESWATKDHELTFGRSERPPSKW
jgi:hypothetical protein